MARIGFIGLGHMGLPMAINLVKAGHTVTGFDLRSEALVQLVEAGGFAADSVQEAGIDKDLWLTMLQTGDQVEQVCLSARGLYASAKQGLHIDCSSIDVKTSRRIHQEALSRKILSLDAPVSGGVTGAVAGTLTFMVGGQRYVFEKAKPYLASMGQRIIHTGGAGTGQAAKICNNMVLGISMIAVSEAFVLAEKLGLDPERLFEVMTHSSGQCWALNNYVPYPGLLPDVPANHDYEPRFTSAMMLKDLNLSQQSTVEVGVSTPLAERATLLYQQFIDMGYGQLDFSGIIKAIKR